MLYEVINWLVTLQRPMLRATCRYSHNFLYHTKGNEPVYISEGSAFGLGFRLFTVAVSPASSSFHTPNDICCHVCCTLQEQRLVQVNNLFEEMDDRLKVRTSAVRDDQRFLFK